MSKTIVTFRGGRCLTNSCTSSGERGATPSEQAQWKRDAEAIEAKKEANVRCLTKKDFEYQGSIPLDTHIALTHKKFDGSQQYRINKDAVKFEAARGNPNFTKNPGLSK